MQRVHQRDPGVDLMETATVEALPQCDFGVAYHEALYDGATTQGPWAYMCEEHFQEFGVGLGMGVGQKLVVNNAG